jgi:prolyl oligopeptidase PreP (S9A serine peptidase family)
MMHFNGIVVEANIRGGGEYGENWHNAGLNFLSQCQNVIYKWKSNSQGVFKISRTASTTSKPPLSI